MKKKAHKTYEKNINEKANNLNDDVVKHGQRSLKIFNLQALYFFLSLILEFKTNNVKELQVSM